MTEYIFRLSDETPKIEIDVKAAAIINGVGQDLYDRAKKELGLPALLRSSSLSSKANEARKAIQARMGTKAILESEANEDCLAYLVQMAQMANVACRVRKAIKATQGQKVLTANQQL